MEQLQVFLQSVAAGGSDRDHIRSAFDSASDDVVDAFVAFCQLHVQNGQCIRQERECNTAALGPLCIGAKCFRARERAASSAVAVQADSIPSVQQEQVMAIEYQQPDDGVREMEARSSQQIVQEKGGWSFRVVPMALNRATFYRSRHIDGYYPSMIKMHVVATVDPDNKRRRFSVQAATGRKIVELYHDQPVGRCVMDVPVGQNVFFEIIGSPRWNPASGCGPCWHYISCMPDLLSEKLFYNFKAEHDYQGGVEKLSIIVQGSRSGCGETLGRFTLAVNLS